MKVSVFNNTTDVFNHDIEGRPFTSISDFKLTDSHDEADYIFGYLVSNKCNEDYDLISKSDTFKKYPHKFVFMAMHDNPSFAYQEKNSIKFIAQPIKNSEYNIISYPLQMRHYELEISKDVEFINELRNTKKEYDFTFIGNKNIPSRLFLNNMKLKSFYTRLPVSIWNLKESKDRLPVLKDFYRDIAKSKFAFAPRGIGSSSFRLYQSLMVGTVPIIFDMMDYPFDDVVNWDEFSIRNLDKKFNFNNLNIDNYEEIRDKGIEFWENYVRIENCDNKLYELLKNKLIT